MNTNFNQFHEEDKVISILDLCRYVLKKWKALLIAAVVCGAVVCAVFTVTGYRSYQASANVSTEQNLANLNISDDQKEIVHMKIDHIADYREVIKEYEHYYNNSIKVKLDPNNVHQGVATYILSGDSKEVLKAALICEKKVFSKEAYEELVARLSEPTDVSMIKEVFLFDRYFVEDGQVQMVADEDSDMEFTVILRHYNEDDCATMLAFVEEKMQGLPAMLEQEGVSVSMEKVSLNLEQGVDRSLAPLSKDIRTAIKNAYEEIARIEYEMNEEQKPYYEYLTGEVVESGNQAPAEKSLADFIDAKMMLLGAAVGILCVAAYFVLMYLLNGRIRSKEELQSWIDVPVLEWKGNAELTAAFVLGAAIKNGMKRIYLSGTRDELNGEAMQQMKTELANGGCEAIVGVNILKNAKAFEEAADCGCVILFEKCDASKEKDLKELMMKTSSCGISILNIVLEK